MSKQIAPIANRSKSSVSRNQRRITKTDGAVFHPWFLPRSTFRSMVKLVPREYLMKMRDYFDRYGCMRCEKRDVTYGQNGMCRPCCSEVGRRLRRCLKARFGDPTTRASTLQVNEAAAGTKLAHKLLRDLIPAMRATTSLSQQKYGTMNPTTGVRV
jgi:hypothetical protein